MDADDALHDPEWLLRGVAGFFLAGGRDDGVPPDVGGRFSARCLLGANQSGRHVGDAVGGIEVEGVVGGVAGVPEDVVVLGGPAFGGARAVVVGPDDLILEAGAAGASVESEDLVKHDLAVVNLSRVDVKKEGTSGSEYAMSFDHSWAEEADVVVKAVGVEGRGVEFGVQAFGAVAVSAEASAVAVGVADGADAGALLRDAGVEGRVNVDEFDAAIGERTEDR